MKKIFFNKKFIIIAILILLVFGGSLYQINAKNKSSDTTKYDEKTEEIISPKRQNISEELTLTGSVDAASKANLQFQTSGQLAWVGVKVGDKVKKYQSIASLNKEALKKQLQVDFNNYRSALASFDDTQDEYKTEKDNLTLTDDMKRILVRSQNTLDNSVINYELQELTLKYATLTSPINGVVTAVEQPNSGINVTPA